MQTSASESVPDGAQSPLDLARVLTQGKFQAPPHLEKVNRALLQVAAGNWKRVAIFMPPRHGKSETASHYGPAWFLGCFPHWRIILTSYEATFAASWGRKVRDSLREAHQMEVFSATVRRDVSATGEWETTGGGGMLTAGVGGAITGRGANLLVIDDPHKNAEEAASLTYRDKAWNWYGSTAYTRLEPGGAVVLMMTRWHLDDLAGRILSLAAEELEDVEPWHVIEFPAEALENDALGRAPGEALWPARYPLPVLRDRKRTLGSYHYAALFQQTPTTREGGFFKRAWFGFVPAPPAEVTGRVRFWDKGATEGGGDWTRGVLMSATAEGLFVVEDVASLQGSSGQVKELIKNTALRDGKRVRIRMEQEPGSAGKDVIADYTRTLVGYNFKGVPATGDKEVRADPVSSQAEAGNVKLVVGAWNEAYLVEMAEFPRGAHDDQVDATSGAFGCLAAPRTLRTREKPAGL